MEWQLMETAPEDQTKIICCDAGGFIFIGVLSIFKSQGWEMAWVTNNGEPIGINPTHWMPLPELPKKEGEVDLQKIIDALGEGHRQARTAYHLTLGDTIDLLSQFEETMIVRFDYIGEEGENSPNNPHSYRGYYSDLALEPGPDRTVKQVVYDLKLSLNKEFTGYKGGEFLMEKNTPLWVAHYGDCGRAIMGLEIRNDQVIIITKEIE